MKNNKSTQVCSRNEKCIDCSRNTLNCKLRCERCEEKYVRKEYFREAWKSSVSSKSGKCVLCKVRIDRENLRCPHCEEGYVIQRQERLGKLYKPPLPSEKNRRVFY